MKYQKNLFLRAPLVVAMTSLLIACGDDNTYVVEEASSPGVESEPVNERVPEVDAYDIRQLPGDFLGNVSWWSIKSGEIVVLMESDRLERQTWILRSSVSYFEVENPENDGGKGIGCTGESGDAHGYINSHGFDQQGLSFIHVMCEHGSNRATVYVDGKVRQTHPINPPASNSTTATIPVAQPTSAVHVDTATLKSGVVTYSVASRGKTGVLCAGTTYEVGEDTGYYWEALGWNWHPTATMSGTHTPVIPAGARIEKVDIQAHDDVCGGTQDKSIEWYAKAT